MGLFFKKKEQKMDETVKVHFSDDFKMSIDDVFAVMGRGTIVVGTITSGVCRVGENVIIQTKTGDINSSITGLEAFRVQMEFAYVGQHVGMLLRGVKKEQLSKGDVITIYNAGVYL